MNRTAPARFPYCPFYPIHPPRTETDETLSGLMGQLREQGYRTYLNTHLALIHTGPEVLTVNVVYQLKGSSDPGDELFLYAIPMQSLKKILVHGVRLGPARHGAGNVLIQDVPLHPVKPNYPILTRRFARNPQ